MYKEKTNTVNYPFICLLSNYACFRTYPITLVSTVSIKDIFVVPYTTKLMSQNDEPSLKTGHGLIIKLLKEYLQF